MGAPVQAVPPMNSLASRPLLALMLALMLAMSACGQAGDLYLPDATPSPDQDDSVNGSF